MAMKMLERYSSAVNSGDLSVNPDTKWSDTDVLGATGLAGRYEPLGVALTRLFADGKAGPATVILAEMAFKRARTMKVKLSQVQATDLSMAVLGWYRHGRCAACGGTGFAVIPGTPHLSENSCVDCSGTGRVPFDQSFSPEVLPVARWMSSEIDRSQAASASVAMSLLKPAMEF